MTNKTTDFNAVDHGSVVLLQGIECDGLTWGQRFAA